MIDGEPWFVAIDVCRSLSLSTVGGAARHMSKLEPTERQVISAAPFVLDPPQSGGRGVLTPRHKLAMVSESGLYKLIMRSDKPEALAFQHWIASEVLPSIRKTGTYALADHGREAMPLPVDLAEALGLAVG